MKTNYISLYLGVTLVALSSCNLDLVPESALTIEEAFQTEQDLNGTTSSIHFYQANILQDNDDYGVFYHVGEIIHEIEGRIGLRNWDPIQVNFSRGDNKGIYDMIYESNLLLDNIDQVKGLSEDRTKYHKGQAYFALGLGYFTLSKMYSQSIITENSTRLTAYEPKPQIEVIDRAIDYALQAYSLLPTYEHLVGYGGKQLMSRQTASKGNSAALLAHLYAWKGSIIDLYKLSGHDSGEAYRKSIEYASHVIEGRVGAYALLEPEELCQAMSDRLKPNAEEIFCIARNTAASEFSSFPMKSTLESFITYPTNEVEKEDEIMIKDYRLRVDKIKQMYPSGDKRLAAFFYDLDSGGEYARIWKWRKGVYDRDDSSSGTADGKRFVTVDANAPVWRLSGLYLLRAECHNKIGETASAIADLNAIREKSGIAPYPSKGEHDLKLAIFRELEREQICEGTRYWDVLRNGREYIKSELQGKFAQLTETDILGGALFLPLPVNTYKDEHGEIVNPNVKLAPYWIAYQ